MKTAEFRKEGSYESLLKATETIFKPQDGHAFEQNTIFGLQGHLKNSTASLLKLFLFFPLSNCVRVIFYVSLVKHQLFFMSYERKTTVFVSFVASCVPSMCSIPPGRWTGEPAGAQQIVNLKPCFSLCLTAATMWIKWKRPDLRERRGE